jgi:hypothetical protein
MRKLSLQDALSVGNSFLLALGAFAAVIALALPSANAVAQSANKKTDLAARPDFREPVVLASKDGVLEVRLTARQRSTR